MFKYEIIETGFHPFLIRIRKNENVTFAISEVMKKNHQPNLKFFSQGFDFQLEIKLEFGQNL